MTENSKVPLKEQLKNNIIMSKKASIGIILKKIGNYCLKQGILDKEIPIQSLVNQEN